jgi:hypothetical protein
MSARVVTSRRTLHPGKVRAERVVTAVGENPRRAMAWLPEGQTLHEAVVPVYRHFGARAGAFYLLGGRLSAARYHVAKPTSEGARVVEYGPPVDIEGGAIVVRITGSYGDDVSGRPLVHMHGVLAGPGGRAHGGHISPDGCVVGPGGVRAIVMLTVGFKQVADSETRFPTFFPISEASLR